jgi:hypothetical protein
MDELCEPCVSLRLRKLVSTSDLWLEDTLASGAYLLVPGSEGVLARSHRVCSVLYPLLMGNGVLSPEVMVPSAFCPQVRGLSIILSLMGV